MSTSSRETTAPSTGESPKDPQGIVDCLSAHTLVEVGEWHEAVDFCNSVIRQPCKTLDGLQTQAYLTVLVAVIDKDVDKTAQLKKARKLWLRVKGKPGHNRASPSELGEVSRRRTQMKWEDVMETLDDTEAYFKDQINAAKLPLEEKIAALEEDIKLAKSPLEDQIIAATLHLEDRIAVLEEELMDAKSPLENKIAAFETTLENEVKAAKLPLENKIASLEDQLKAAGSPLESKLAALEEGFEKELEAAKLPLENKIESLENKLKAADAPLESRLAALETAFENELEDAKAPLENIIAGLKNELKASKSTLAEKITALEAELKAAKTPLKNKTSVLEKDLLAARSEVTELEDQLKSKQDSIDFLAAEVAIHRSKPASEYSGTTQGGRASRNWSAAWPFSLCMGSQSNEDSFDESTMTDKSRVAALGQKHSKSMILDTKGLARYSTSGELMSDGNNEKTSDSSNLASDDARLSDLDKLMMNGPILVRPGRPLAYVDDSGQIIEVALEITDLPPMMFPHPAMSSLSPDSAQAGKPRHRSTRF